MRLRLVAALWVGIGATAFAQLPTHVATGTISVRTTLVATGTSALIDMAVRPGEIDRFFIATKSGTIRILQNGSFASQPFLDISTGFGLIDGGETGLLGLAIHPEFKTASAAGFGKFYTYTSEQKGTNAADFFTESDGPIGGYHHNVLREWSVDPAASSVPATASRVLFRSANPTGVHNGGAIKFGPDNLLYISLGDGGSPPLSAQDRTLILGKIARINPTAANPPNGRYGIPADNPFAALGDVGLDEVYAMGLRNPFRMQFDRITGKLYVGDVGLSNREEVDEVAIGGNYGWPYFEGTNPRSMRPVGLELVAPLAEYTHSYGRSVIGGFVYRGSEIPELYGKYVFGDASSETLRYIDLQGGQIYSLLRAPGSTSLNNSLYGWGEDSNGELYGLYSSGRVIRLSAVPEPSILVAGIAVGILRRRRR